MRRAVATPTRAKGIRGWGAFLSRFAGTPKPSGQRHGAGRKAAKKRPQPKPGAVGGGSTRSPQDNPLATRGTNGGRAGRMWPRRLSAAAGRSARRNKSPQPAGRGSWPRPQRGRRAVLWRGSLRCPRVGWIGIDPVDNCLGGSHRKRPRNKAVISVAVSHRILANRRFLQAGRLSIFVDGLDDLISVHM